MRLDRIWGLRLLARPDFMRRLQAALLLVLVGYYLLWSAGQLLTVTALDFQHDFLDYYRAAGFARHGEGIYSDFVRLWGNEQWAVGYIYPPLLALTLIPLALLPVEVAGRIWLLGIHLAFLAALATCLAVQPKLSRSARVTIAVAFFFFLPVFLALKFQQVAALWLLLLVVVLWAYQRRRHYLCALALALAASLKVIPVLLVLFFLRKREFRLAALSVAALVVVTAGEILLVRDGLYYAGGVLPTISAGTSNPDNASINGLVSRIVEIFPQVTGPLPPRPVAGLVLVLATVALLAITLRAIAPHPVPAPAGRLELALFVAVMPMISSVTWQHHLVTLLLPISLVIGHFYTQGPVPRRQLAILVASYCLLWIDSRLLGLHEFHPHGWHGAAVLAATSLRLLGMALLWGLLLHLVPQARRAGSLTRPAANAPPLSPPRAA